MLVIAFLGVITTLDTKHSLSAQSSSPIGYYPFDEGTGTTTADASGNAQHATPTGATGLPQWTGGMLSGALYFDGVDDSVRITSGIVSGSPLDLSGKHRTYAAWVQWNNNYTKYIVASNDGAAHLNGLFTTNDTNRGRFRLAVDGGTFADTAIVCTAVTPVAGRWYHVVGTWDGAVARIYVDGAPCNAWAPGTTDYDMAGDAMRVGSSRGTAGFWKSEIDDVRIYDRTLTADEIQALYEHIQVQPNPGAVRIRQFSDRRCHALLSGVAVIPAGESKVSITVTALEDGDIEETESVAVSLVASSTYLIQGAGTVTLYASDNDSPSTGPIIIDHTSVSLFDDIPERYLAEVRRCGSTLRASRIPGRSGTASTILR